MPPSPPPKMGVNNFVSGTYRIFISSAQTKVALKVCECPSGDDLKLYFSYEISLVHVN